MKPHKKPRLKSGFWIGYYNKPKFENSTLESNWS
jgi:hypothetical protein